MNWKWGPKQSVVVSDPANEAVQVELAWGAPPYGEVQAFSFELEKARRVYVTLESARDAYEGGRAKYENASQEVRHLLVEGNKAAIELIQTMAHLDRWFESPVSPLFEGDADGFLRFCKEWIARQGPPPEVLGNSSRGPSANLRNRPPGTAGTANGSSLEKGANQPGSATGKTKGSRRKTAADASTS